MGWGRRTTLNWPLVLGLGALALLRPALSLLGLRDALGTPAVPVLSTAAISLVWIGAVGFSRAPWPFLALVAARLTYAVLSIALSAVLSPLLTGELQGPLATPAAIGPVLVTNAVWGAIMGGIALLVRRLRAAG